MSIRSRCAKLTTLAGIGLGIAALPALATDTSHTTLGPGDKVYSILAGPLDQLLPGGGFSDSRGLVLRITDPSGDTTLELVPGTDDAAVDLSPQLFYEGVSDTLYFFWVSQHIHSRLNLTSYRQGEGFGEEIEISGNPFSFKDQLRIVINGSTFWEVRGDGSIRESVRKVLHLLWLAEGPDGHMDAYGTWLVFAEGAYGRNPVYRLRDFFDGTRSDSPAAALPPALQATPRGALAVFSDPSAAKLRILSLQIIPEALSRLLEKVRGQITQFGAWFRFGAEVPAKSAIGDYIYDFILREGSGLHRDLVRLLALEAKRLAEEDAGRPIDGDAFMEHLLDYGFELSQGFRQNAGESASFLIPVRGSQSASSLDASGETLEPPHFVRAVSTASVPLPELDCGISNLYVSPGADRLIAACDGEDYVRYREAQERLGSWRAWQEPRTLALGPNLTAEAAHAILRGLVGAQ